LSCADIIKITFLFSRYQFLKCLRWKRSKTLVYTEILLCWHWTYTFLFYLIIKMSWQKGELRKTLRKSFRKLYIQNMLIRIRLYIRSQMNHETVSWACFVNYRDYVTILFGIRPIRKDLNSVGTSKETLNYFILCKSVFLFSSAILPILVIHDSTPLEQELRRSCILEMKTKREDIFVKSVREVQEPSFVLHEPYE